MTTSKTAALLIGTISLSLAGCDRIAATQGNDHGVAVSGDTRSPDQLDAYIDAHNRLVGTFGFYEKAANYRKADVAHASVDGQFLVDEGWIQKGIDQLKTARAMSGAPADLNTAADAVIASMTKVRTHLADLAPYYTGKAYMDDKLARGRREDPQMLAELVTADVDLSRFSAMIDRDVRTREMARLATLKAKGDLLGYNRRLAMFQASAFITRFGTAQKPDAVLFQRSDADVAIIETAIAAAHTEAAKAGEADPSELQFLSSMIGHYRAFRKNRLPADADMMLGGYNSAVEAANR